MIVVISCLGEISLPMKGLADTTPCAGYQAALCQSCQSNFSSYSIRVHPTTDPDLRIGCVLVQSLPLVVSWHLRCGRSMPTGAGVSDQLIYSILSSVRNSCHLPPCGCGLWE